MQKAALRARLDRVTLVGGLIITAFFGILGGWLVIAPLSSAAVATGIVSPDSSRKSIQHLEGGIVREVLVKDGDVVAAGQPLVLLEDTQARAQAQALRAQWHRLAAVRSRISSLKADRAAPEFVRETLDAAVADAELASFLRTQAELFKTRKEGQQSQVEMLRRQVQQLAEQKLGREAESTGYVEQLRLLDDELTGLKALLAQGNALKSRVMQLLRLRAEAESKAAASRAAMAAVEQKIAETQLAISASESEYRDKLAEELVRTNTEIALLEERLAAAEDVLRRTAISAPVDGTIVGLRLRTTGGVVKPGEVLVQIVPSHDALVIDTRVQPVDIAAVHVGQRAQVHLLPFAQRNLPIIEGKVAHVGADSMTDERTGERFYDAKVVVERELIKHIAPEIEMSAGMPADVLIVTGERSAFRYIVEPIERSFRLSFRQL
jgi:membrane fusion protein, type I secretion system